MTNIYLTVNRAQVDARIQGLLTGGMVGVPVTISYDVTWTGLTKTVVFRAGGVTVDRVNVENQTQVPGQILQKQNCTLYIGVYGTNADGSVVVPTVWTQVGTILPGADPCGDESTDPALPVWEQLLKMQNQYLSQSQRMVEQIDMALDEILRIQEELIGGGCG